MYEVEIETGAYTGTIPHTGHQGYWAGAFQSSHRGHQGYWAGAFQSSHRSETTTDGRTFLQQALELDGRF